ncbi:hypothetical protein LA080_005861 [Diaporthe eres]|nr:hypothetical protein LA080_005861 [Diaporthe eres]
MRKKYRDEPGPSFLPVRSLLHPKNADLAMILDSTGNAIMFQCSDSIRQRFNMTIDRTVTTTCQYSETSGPPDLTFRLMNNDSRLAKSEVYHFRCRFSIVYMDEDVTGPKPGDPFPTKHARNFMMLSLIVTPVQKLTEFTRPV